jgi:hypothetical protein
MLKACIDCQKLRSMSGDTIECSGHPTQYVQDPWNHAKTYFCVNFEPKWPAAEELTILRTFLAGPNQSLRSALERWFAGPPNDVTVSASGSARLSVADGGLKPFESDDTLKSYPQNNFVFGDLLGPVRVRSPFVVYLSPSNPSGADVTWTAESLMAILALGRPYSLVEVLAALSYILAQQDIAVVCPWFLRQLKEAGIDTTEPSFSSFVWLPVAFSRWLAPRKSELMGTRTVILGDDTVEPEAVADALELEPETTAVLICDASEKLHWSHKGVFERDVCAYGKVREFLEARGIRSVLMGLRHWDNAPKRFKEDSFSGVQTAVIYADKAAGRQLKSLDAFADFTYLAVPDG